MAWATSYTEHQKKSVTSLERLSLKSVTSNSIIFGYKQAIVTPCEAHLFKKLACVKKEKNAVK